MRLSGKVYGGDETLPLANIIVSDSSGKQTSALKGVSADIDGNYSIDVNASDFLTVSYVGMGSKTIKVSDTCNTSCNYDFKLSSGHNLKEFEVIGITDKTKWKRIAIIGGISLVALISGIITYNYFKGK